MQNLLHRKVPQFSFDETLSDESIHRFPDLESQDRPALTHRYRGGEKRVLLQVLRFHLIWILVYVTHCQEGTGRISNEGQLLDFELLPQRFQVLNI